MTTICGPCSRIRDGRYFNDLCESCAGWWLLGCSTDEAGDFRVGLVPGVMVT